jgi:hypothetical protein
MPHIIEAAMDRDFKKLDTEESIMNELLKAAVAWFNGSPHFVATTTHRVRVNLEDGTTFAACFPMHRPAHEYAEWVFKQPTVSEVAGGPSTGVRN